MVKIRMRTAGGGPKMSWGAGAVIEADQETADMWVAGGYGMILEEPAPKVEDDEVDGEATALMLLTKEALLELAKKHEINVEASWPKARIVNELRIEGVTVPAEVETAADAGPGDEQAATTDGPQPRERVPVDDSTAVTGDGSGEPVPPVDPDRQG